MPPKSSPTSVAQAAHTQRLGPAIWCKHAEEQRLQPEPEIRLKQPAKQELFAERAREREHHDTDGAHVLRERAELEVQIFRPGEARDRKARSHREERSERRAERHAVEHVARGSAAAATGAAGRRGSRPRVANAISTATSAMKA